MPDAAELLELERAEAWRLYLEATRGQQEPRYSRIEPWAWARLESKLGAIAGRERRIAA